MYGKKLHTIRKLINDLITHKKEKSVKKLERRRNQIKFLTVLGFLFFAAWFFCYCLFISVLVFGSWKHVTNYLKECSFTFFFSFFLSIRSKWKKERNAKSYAKIPFRQIEVNELWWTVWCVCVCVCKLRNILDCFFNFFNKKNKNVCKFNRINTKQVGKNMLTISKENEINWLVSLFWTALWFLFCFNKLVRLWKL